MTQLAITSSPDPLENPLGLLVRSRGLEPPRVAPLAPQASASTNSATTACGVGAPDRRPRTQAADVTARLRPDKAARGGPCMGPDRDRPRLRQPRHLRYSSPMAI